MHFKILSFSSLIIWFFDNPFRLAHLTLLFSLMISSFFLLAFFIFSKKKLNFIQGIGLVFFLLVFLVSLSVSLLYNLNLFLFLKYGVWLDFVVWKTYYLHDGMVNLTFINKIRLIYTMFFIDVEWVKKIPDFYKDVRQFNPKKINYFITLKVYYLFVHWQQGLVKNSPIQGIFWF